MICTLTEVSIQQVAVGFAFLDNLEGEGAGEVAESVAWDELGVMGFGDAEPAAVDPSADGFVFIAKDGFRVLWGDDVGHLRRRCSSPFIFSSVVIV